MRVTKFIQALILALYWQLPLGKQTELRVVQNPITRDLSKKRKQEKKRRRQQQQQFKWHEQKRKISGYKKITKPKDVRFSDHRKLRRMYLNL